MKPSPENTERRRWIAAAVVVVAIWLAYLNSFGGPFLFDDLQAIVENPTLRSLASWDIFRPPAGRGLTVEGRPLLNASLAVNRAISGDAVWSYHAANLLIHAAAALALLGLVRRTFSLPVFSSRIREAAPGLALVIALAWALHPIQTESVTYVVQRAESLMGMWVWFAWYAFVRAASPGSDPRWRIVAVAATFAAAAAKEVAAVLPVLVFLYDRTFIAGSFREAWTRRGGLHLAMAGSWLLVGALVAGSGSRGGTVGFGSQVAWHEYALTQFDALARYVKLSVWPHPLVFDYGTEWVTSVVDVLPAIIVVTLLAGATLIGLWRWPRWAFLAVLFLAPLAPTSLIPGNRQTMAEHRLYLSLAGVVVAVVCAGFGMLERRRRIFRCGLAVGVLVALGLLTWRRNETYQTALALYTDTAAQRPNNAFARYNLGKCLDEAGAPAEALVEYRAAVRLMPGMFVAHCNLGSTLLKLHRIAEAETAFRTAVAIEPRHALSQFNLGVTLLGQGRKAEAKEHFSAAARAAPEMVEARENLGAVLLDLGDYDGARREFEQRLAQAPATAVLHFNLGATYRLLGRIPDATAFRSGPHARSFPRAGEGGNSRTGSLKRLQDTLAAIRRENGPKVGAEFCPARHRWFLPGADKRSLTGDLSREPNPASQVHRRIPNGSNNRAHPRSGAVQRRHSCG